MLVAKAHLSLLREGEGPQILNISSTSGSLNEKSSGGGYSYCSSKAALNMLSRTLAFDLKSDGIIVVALHPGWVSTDMGGSAAPMDPPESATAILDLAEDLTMRDTGGFYRRDGRRAPW
jgi:NAD(P)-dependent dehydrogenase (short-subunit alcohol dehydrogenase family)